MAMALQRHFSVPPLTVVMRLLSLAALSAAIGTEFLMLLQR